jgi:hypothetical protein
MRNRLVIVLAVAVGLLVSVSMFAHHGGASFATGEQITLKGTVTKWVYLNPHLLLMVDVKGEDGKVVNWVLETQSPVVMYPSGYRRDSFKPGDEVTVLAGPAKNGQPVGRIIEVVKADGTKFGRFRPAAGSTEQ